MNALQNMPAHSRVWIYQSSRDLTSSEADSIRAAALAFLDQWTSHGALMNAAIDVLHNRFIVVSVDEQTAPASGCGIDKSVKFIQEVEKQLNLSLLDRMQVAYRKEGKILSTSLSQLKQVLEQAFGEKTGEAIVFNNMVGTKAEMESSWEIPLRESWHYTKL